MKSYRKVVNLDVTTPRMNSEDSGATPGLCTDLCFHVQLPTKQLYTGKKNI
jgi:hypothetical protein